MKSILALTDFSPIAMHGVEAGLKFAEELRAELTILYAEKDGFTIDANLNDKQELPHLIKNLSHKEQINEWIRLSEGLPKVNLKLENKSFEIAFIQLLQKTDFDIIIMSSTGKGSSKEYWGSTTEMVVSEARIPVLILKDALQETSFHKILFASSFDEDEKRCFQIMKELIPISKKANIHLLSINTESYFTQPSSLIMEVMEDYKEMAMPINSEVHFFRDYNVDAGIRHFADELKPDLIVMSDKNKKPVKHLLMGHDALKVASMSKFPVLILDYK